jgi:hypothetical protein
LEQPWRFGSRDRGRRPASRVAGERGNKLRQRLGDLDRLAPETHTHPVGGDHDVTDPEPEDPCQRLRVDEDQQSGDAVAEVDLVVVYQSPARGRRA